MKNTILLLIIFLSGTYTNAQESMMTVEQATHFSDLALHCIHQEYPNKTGHISSEEVPTGTPQELHPAFYGCFDWHSSVHGHWMLVRLLKAFPDHPHREEIKAAISKNLQAENITAEVAYFNTPVNNNFERSYGWAWLLKLHEELYTWNDPWAAQQLQNLTPLSELIADKFEDFLQRLSHPIRVGTHTNTAFAMSFAYDYAHTLGKEEMKTLIAQRAVHFFKSDRNYPAAWEPNGFDFFSPAMQEMSLMQKVLSPEEFSRWMQSFLPDFDQAKLSLRLPVESPDRTDGHMVHLDGLNFSRAWCYAELSRAFPARKAELHQLAMAHIRKSLDHVASGDYMGEHWLASFVVFAYDRMGLLPQ